MGRYARQYAGTGVVVEAGLRRFRNKLNSGHLAMAAVVRFPSPPDDGENDHARREERVCPREEAGRRFIAVFPCVEIARALTRDRDF